MEKIQILFILTFLFPYFSRCFSFMNYCLGTTASPQCFKTHVPWQKNILYLHISNAHWLSYWAAQMQNICIISEISTDWTVQNSSVCLTLLDNFMYFLNFHSYFIPGTMESFYAGVFNSVLPVKNFLDRIE